MGKSTRSMNTTGVDPVPSNVSASILASGSPDIGNTVPADSGLYGFGLGTLRGLQKFGSGTIRNTRNLFPNLWTFRDSSAATVVPNSGEADQNKGAVNEGSADNPTVEEDPQWASLGQNHEDLFDERIDLEVSIDNQVSDSDSDLGNLYRSAQEADTELRKIKGKEFKTPGELTTAIEKAARLKSEYEHRRLESYPELQELTIKTLEAELKVDQYDLDKFEASHDMSKPSPAEENEHDKLEEFVEKTKEELDKARVIRQEAAEKAQREAEEAEEARREAEEARRKAEEAQRKAEEAQRKAEEAQTEEQNAETTEAQTQADYSNAAVNQAKIEERIGKLEVLVAEGKRDLGVNAVNTSNLEEGSPAYNESVAVGRQIKDRVDNDQATLEGTKEELRQANANVIKLEKKLAEKKEASKQATERRERAEKEEEEARKRAEEAGKKAGNKEQNANQKRTEGGSESEGKGSESQGSGGKSQTRPDISDVTEYARLLPAGALATRLILGGRRKGGSKKSPKNRRSRSAASKSTVSPTSVSTLRVPERRSSASPSERPLSSSRLTDIVRQLVDEIEMGLKENYFRTSEQTVDFRDYTGSRNEVRRLERHLNRVRQQVQDQNRIDDLERLIGAEEAKLFRTENEKLRRW